MKTQISIWVPPPAFLIQRIWIEVKAGEFMFLTIFQVMQMLCPRTAVITIPLNITNTEPAAIKHLNPLIYSLVSTILKSTPCPE